MAESKMKEVAKLLGVEWGVPFKVKYDNATELSYNPYVFKNNGLCSRNGDFVYSVLVNLLKGEYEIEKQILDEVEKRYLEGVFRPFKDRVKCVNKMERTAGTREFLQYCVKDPINGLYYNYPLPYFKKGTMYKGMELDKEYTLEELELFQD